MSKLEIAQKKVATRQLVEKIVEFESDLEAVIVTSRSSFLAYQHGPIDRSLRKKQEAIDARKAFIAKWGPK